MGCFTVITTIGHDRVGIADDLSTEIVKWNCNIEESKMAVFGKEFVAILLVSGETENVRALENDIRSLEKSLQLHINIKETELKPTRKKSIPYFIETVSMDTPGIVHSITHTLHSNNINIEDMETDTSPAPWTGTPMFHMRLKVTIPSSVSIKDFREQMEQIAKDQDLDLTVHPLVSQ